VAVLIAADRGELDSFNFGPSKASTVKTEAKRLPLPPIPALPEEGVNVEIPDGDKAIELLKAIIGSDSAPIDKSMVEEIVDNRVETRMKSITAPRIEISNLDTGERKEIDRQHYKFALVMALYQARIPAMLVGPPGSGKTTLAVSIANSFTPALPWEAVSFGPMTSKADMFGYKDANGNYHDTSLIRRIKEGGVFLGDEMDASNAGVLTGVNMVLANGHVATPEGMIEKHKDFWFMAGCNTYGQGADRVMVGRQQLDGATLDRFAVVDFPIDMGIMAYSMGLDRPSPRFKLDQGGPCTVDEWFDYVAKVMGVVERLQLRPFIGPRAGQYGAKLLSLKTPVGRTHLEDMLIWKGMDTATRKKVEAAL
tara:strand:- start:42 stop:1139 length:1098 start_codon:yes stop_codon:yes gene_type:complete